MLTKLDKRHILAATSAVLTVTTLILGCGSGTGDPVGYGDDDEPVYRVVLSPKTGWRDTYYDVYVPTGKSPRLAVGSYAGFTSRILLRFDLEDIPKIVSVEDITNVVLRLAYYRESGELNDASYAYGDVTISAHRLFAGFDEDRATWYRARRYRNWTEPGGEFGPAVAEAIIGDPPYKREYIRLDITDTFFEWVNNPDANYGLMLKAVGEATTDGIKEFFSIDEKSKEDAPRLVITYIDDDGEKAYHEVIPQKDCFITLADSKFAGDTVNGHEKELEFGSFNGYGRRLLVRFDLSPSKSGIPADASIIRARLRLFYRPAGRDDRVGIAGYQLLSGFTQSDTQDKLESIRYHDNEKYVERDFEKEKPGYVDLYINELLQEWVTGTKLNHGLMIKADDETEAAVFPTFASADTNQPERTPHLEVLFTSPTPPWFDVPEGTSSSPGGFTPDMEVPGCGPR
ncbi:MAG: DNRLRE domain-containing protein [Candidatus Coatesbacteria bacterium]|nr:MAG: DNRLRE domain-containing protein [Candidatus Coatesbacteria bacterium]